MAQYRKKPILVDAIRYDGTNWDDIADLLDLEDVTHGPNNSIIIDTLEGKTVADVGDYVIRGTAGEGYPCKASIFDHIYEPAGER